MNKIIRNKDNGYSVINNHCLRNKNISEKAKGVFAIIMSLPDNWDFSINGLVTICNGGESAIRSAIKELIENGYCQRNVIKHPTTKRIIDWEYTFSEKPLCDFPQVEEPKVENPHLENHTQLNKDESIIKKNKEREILFESLWEIYPTKADKKLSKERFMKLSLIDVDLVKAHLPIFSKVKPFSTYTHPHFSVYLSKERFKDDVKQDYKSETKQQQSTMYKVLTKDTYESEFF